MTSFDVLPSHVVERIGQVKNGIERVELSIETKHPDHGSHYRAVLTRSRRGTACELRHDTWYRHQSTWTPCHDKEQPLVAVVQAVPQAVMDALVAAVFLRCNRGFLESYHPLVTLRVDGVTTRTHLCTMPPNRRGRPRARFPTREAFAELAGIVADFCAGAGEPPPPCSPDLAPLFADPYGAALAQRLAAQSTSLHFERFETAESATERVDSKIRLTATRTGNQVAISATLATTAFSMVEGYRGRAPANTRTIDIITPSTVAADVDALRAALVPKLALVLAWQLERDAPDYPVDMDMTLCVGQGGMTNVDLCVSEIACEVAAPHAIVQAAIDAVEHGLGRDAERAMLGLLCM
jgi:hypothetical protein